MRPYQTLIAASIALSIINPCSAIVLQHDADIQHHLQLASQYSYVGNVWSGDPNSGAGEAGTGTLIAPEWVLTAAHVVEGDLTRFALASETYEAREVFVHPEWNGRVFDGHDLALIRLDRVVQGIEPGVYDSQHDPIGQKATFVGFGQSGNGLTGRVGESGTLHAGQNILDAVGSDFWFLLDDSLLMADFDYPFPLDQTLSGNDAFGQTQIPTALSGGTHINRMGDPDPLPLESLPGGGDSGGGVFIDMDGEQVLIGTISMTLSWDGSNNSGYTDMVGVVSLASADGWIQSTVPEPSSGVMFGIAAWFGLCRRRR